MSPLKPGRSKKVVSENIGELMHSYDEKGTIGTSAPSSRKKAQKQAIAIALEKAGKSRKKKKKGGVAGDSGKGQKTAETKKAKAKKS